MKPTTPVPPAREFAGTSGRRPLRQILCWALAGFGFGVGAASAYLLLGGEYLWNIPRWAAFVFYPGFAAGVQANQWGLRVGPSQVVGVLAVGCTYALLALLLRLACSTVRKKRAAKGASDRTTSPFSRSCLLALLLLIAAISTQAENLWPIPDHVWVLGVDSHHPVGVAWDDPVGAGVHSSNQIYLCFGMQHPWEMRLPVLVLGLLMLGVFSALMLGLAHRFKQRKTGPP